jgi:glycosyltransferase involved in cell wall biosynthesis
VMLESLACGTPVVATPRGAAPEIVQEGVTGFVADGIDALCHAVDLVQGLNRADCRAAAVESFSGQRMVREHSSLYASIVV